MSHAAGKKVASRHTTIIEAAEPVVKAANKLDCVTNIVLGVIQQGKGAAAKKSLKITDIPAGLQVKVRGPKTVQELFIYTSNRTLTSSTISEAFRK